MIYRYKPPYELKPGVWVFPPTDDGKAQGYDILERILRKWTPPDHYYHFRDGGHVKAIHDHQQNKLFSVADIKSFFQSTTRSMVIKALVKVGFKFSDALEIGTNSSVKHAAFGDRKFLPYGFVQSALLATLCLECSRLGAVIRDTLETDLLVSVYMDDIILSGTENDAELLAETYKGICSVAGDPPYQLNLGKSQGPARSIRVFNTELSHGYVEVLDERLKAFKSALDGYESQHAVQAVIRYVEGLNTDQSKELEYHVAKRPHV